MLTDLQCKRAKAGEKDYKLADARGLYLFVTKSGFRSLRWKFRFAGKGKRLVLGSYPEMSLGSAREARENAARLLKSGVDPSLQAKQLASIGLEEAAATFEAVAREWHGQQVSGWGPRHAANVLKSLEQDVFPKIGALPIKGITSPMVLEVVRAIEDRPSIETARRVRQRISAVYSYAIASVLPLPIRQHRSGRPSSR
ncbi:integrase arm-type DNA-binding domain-containing protein [Novosphingobium sp. RD2P27]|uniref:Integrase arm-type DNA-binding domain-containing protein n=1 Tax=Novosphingobium kalidii TaxID=3230299 RepID=A0ABV2CW81_9SPHN